MNALKRILPSLALMTALTVEAQQAYNPAQAGVSTPAEPERSRSLDNGHHSRDELKVIAELHCKRL
jgi:hypothetical protein